MGCNLTQMEWYCIFDKYYEVKKEIFTHFSAENSFEKLMTSRIRFLCCFNKKIKKPWSMQRKLAITLLVCSYSTLHDRIIQKTYQELKNQLGSDVTFLMLVYSKITKHGCIEDEKCYATMFFFELFSNSYTTPNPNLRILIKDTIQQIKYVCVSLSCLLINRLFDWTASSPYCAFI